MNSLKHHFLIAMPILKDSTFGRSVVYICEHTKEGAMGLIINKPMIIQLGKVMRHLKIKTADDSVKHQEVYMGGPVGQEHGFILYEEPENEKKSSSVELKISTSKEILENIAKGKNPHRYLVTLGYAGWEAGQMEQEINCNDWLVVPYNPAILFDVPASHRWQAAAKLLGVDIHQITEQVGHA
jgi:putative transcriptional regulator